MDQYLDHIFNNGVKAFRDGVELSDCASPEKDEWIAGWKAGKACEEKIVNSLCEEHESTSF